jgi:hypothetical protein
MARAVHILALYRDINLVPNLEVYRPAVFIYLCLLALLNSLDSTINSLLRAIYPLSKLYYFVTGHLSTDAYRFIYYGP